MATAANGDPTHCATHPYVRKLYGNTGGLDSEPVDFNFSNEGSTAVTISSIVLSDSSDFRFTSQCGSTIAAYSSCNILVYFTPQAATSYNATLTITTNGSPSALTAPLTGTGTSPTPKVQLAPTYANFPATPVGSTVNPWTFNFSNAGSSAVTVSSIVLSDPTDFRYTSQCGTTVAAYSSCNILVYFIPQAAQSYNASPTVNTNGDPSASATRAQPR